jgi:hypothetical protein
LPTSGLPSSITLRKSTRRSAAIRRIRRADTCPPLGSDSGREGLWPRVAEACVSCVAVASPSGVQSDLIPVRGCIYSSRGPDWAV